MKKNYDFAGWATKNNIRCSDGRTILRDAFAGNDGSTVPLVWNHQHNDPDEVLGHADLQNRKDGVYAYCYLNDTPKGNTAKELVQHGDIVALSIYANHLKENNGNVIHGQIREVSLVLAGANKGAVIDHVLEHGEGESDDEAVIMFYDGDDDISLCHSDEGDDMDMDDQTVEEVMDTLNEDQQQAVAIVLGQILEDHGVNLDDDDEYDDDDDEMSHADQDDDDEGDGDETIGDVLKTFTPKQRKVLNYLVGQALAKNNGEGDNGTMKHNAFDDINGGDQTEYLSHSDELEIFESAKRNTHSLKAAVEMFDDTHNTELRHSDIDYSSSSTNLGYGIYDESYLFPDARVINPTPSFISRNMTWVEKVMSATKHTPFSRVKSIFADITGDEARARGYIKGHLKKEEVFSLLKRTTEPQTIYKKQKVDKDTIDDITSFDIVAWIKTEMQMMFREEIARAILIGDGRLNSSEDKILEDHIRPVYNDADLFTIKVGVKIPTGASDKIKAKALRRAAIKARKLYKGAGSPTFYTVEDELNRFQLLEDEIGHQLYDSDAQIATALRVSNIVTVEPMEGKTIEILQDDNTKKSFPLAGIIVNLTDYNIGTNGGAKTDFFDDFDIDYNQYKYLYETRMSGALVTPYSCLSFYWIEDDSVVEDSKSGVHAGDVITSADPIKDGH